MLTLLTRLIASTCIAVSDNDCSPSMSNSRPHGFLPNTAHTQHSSNPIVSTVYLQVYMYGARVEI